MARRGRRKRRRALRALVGVGVPAIVAVAAVVVYLHVELASRFEGPTWVVPSRVVASRLVASPGDPLPLDALEEVLRDSGYEAVGGAPELPGTYRRRGNDLELRRRGSGDPTLPAARCRLRVEDGRLAWVRCDPASPGPNRFEFEPEPLALLFGRRHEDRRPLPLDRIPETLIHAVLAAEDARFYEHHGIDARAVARAIWANLRHGRIVQGGSTITQQTVKNLYLDGERTWWRKGREAAMAVLLDLEYSKDRILEVYLNEVYLGQNGTVAVCGVGSAARFFFGRDAAELSTGEMAFLAGLIRNPGGYHPTRRPERALARRDRVLDAMVERGFLSPAEADRAKREPLEAVAAPPATSRAPWAVARARSELGRIELARATVDRGLSVRTTLDPILQVAAERAVASGLERLGREGRSPEAAVLALDPRDGRILAHVGGRDFSTSQFDRIVQARRQPGSCFKPFVYLAGFEAAARGRAGGITPSSLLVDEPLEVVAGGRTWSPRNHDGRFRGPVTVRRALVESLNVPTVRAAQSVGLDEVVRTAASCGLAGLRPLPSLALGAQEVTPIDLAAAYAALANGGTWIEPHVLEEVRDADGTRIALPVADARRAASAPSSFLVSHVLRGVLGENGTASSARALGFRGEVSGKTGTTDGTHDAWFVGYTSDLLVLVWVGHDEPRPTGLSGASGALPIWVDMLGRAGRENAGGPLPVPPGIVRATIDPSTGLLATAGCPDREAEVFARGTEPRERCRVHGGGPLRWLRRLLGRDD